MKKIISGMFLGAMLLSSSAFSWQWVSDGTVASFQATTSLILINLETAHENADGCTNETAQNYLAIDMTEASAQWLYSTALSAFMGGKSLSFASSGCISNPDWVEGGTYPKLSTVQVSQ